MAGTKNHDYHILPPDPWPIIGAFSSLALFGGAVMWMHGNPYGMFVTLAGLAAVLVTFYSWWSNTIKEAHAGDHTPVVSLHLRYGMILFIASEVMFFVAWFWAFFSAALFPSAADAVGGQWPPKGLEVIDPFGFPLLNTLILLCSGTTVTWAHHALIHGDREGLKKGLLATIALGLVFTGDPGLRIYPRAVRLQTGQWRQHLSLDLLHGDRLPRLPRHRRHDLPDRLLSARGEGRLHPQAAFRLRGGGLVLALRRRRVAVPVRRRSTCGAAGARRSTAERSNDRRRPWRGPA